MITTLREVTAVLAGKRFPLEDEKATQAAIGEAFAKASCLFEREVRLDGGIIDFMVGGYRGVGVEVKLKGQPEAIRRQLRRYALDPRVEGLVLVTAKPVGLVQTIAGKPVREFDIGRAWL